MALSERSFIDKIEILENKIIGVRQATIIERDGVVVSTTYHRWTFGPGENISHMSADVQNIANLLWTAEVIEAYQSTIQNQ